jgi:hypothetical protein
VFCTVGFLAFLFAFISCVAVAARALYNHSLLRFFVSFRFGFGFVFFCFCFRDLVLVVVRFRLY